MRVFTCKSNETVAVVSAYNRGHAVKLLAKEFEARGCGGVEKNSVHEFDPEKNGRKGNIVFLAMNTK